MSKAIVAVLLICVRMFLLPALFVWLWNGWFTDWYQFTYWDAFMLRFLIAWMLPTSKE